MINTTRQTLAALLICDWDDALAEEAKRNGETYELPLPVVETILGMKHIDGRAVGPNRDNCEHCSPRAIADKRKRERTSVPAASPFVSKTAKTIAADLFEQFAVCVGNFETSGALAVKDCVRGLDTSFKGVESEFNRLVSVEAQATL
jgi:hypothetical protein